MWVSVCLSGEPTAVPVAACLDTELGSLLIRPGKMVLGIHISHCTWESGRVVGGGEVVEYESGRIVEM